MLILIVNECIFLKKKLCEAFNEESDTFVFYYFLQVINCILTRIVRKEKLR